MQEITHCFETLAGVNIDRANGVISGVSVITIGDAKGHGIKIDRRTLEMVAEVGNEFSNGVKVKLRHKSTGQHQDVVGETIGLLKQFSVSGDKTRAVFHLFKSLSAETKDKIFEMAELMPDQFGFSIDFTGVNEEKDGVKFARCEELNSVDLSDKPAANPDGLFSMKSIKYESGDKGKHAKDCDCDDCEKSKSKSMSNEEISQSITTLTDLVTKLSAKVEASATASTATLSFKNDKGETVQLSAQEISTKLSEVTQLASATKTATETALKKSIIDGMDKDGRVPMNPKDGKAFTRVELEAMTVENLQFAAVNSPRVPLAELHKIRNETKKSTIAADVKGSDRVQAALSAKGYDDIDELMAAPIGTTLG